MAMLMKTLILMGRTTTSLSLVHVISTDVHDLNLTSLPESTLLHSPRPRPEPKSAQHSYATKTMLMRHCRVTMRRKGTRIAPSDDRENLIERTKRKLGKRLGPPPSLKYAPRPELWPYRGTSYALSPFEKNRCHCPGRGPHLI
jgi:hypothetical protein